MRGTRVDQPRKDEDGRTFAQSIDYIQRLSGGGSRQTYKVTPDIRGPFDGEAPITCDLTDRAARTVRYGGDGCERLS